MCWLALDLGASFLKAAIVDVNLRRLGTVVRRPFPAFMMAEVAGRREIDADIVYQAALEMLVGLAKQAPGCRGLVISGQMHGFVFCDRKSGSALGPYISWQDQRCLEMHPSHRGTYWELLKERLGTRLVEETGNEIRPGFSIANLFWYAEQGLIPAGSSAVSLMDYVATRLAEKTVGTHASNAAGHGLYDTRKGIWHSDAYARAGLGSLCRTEVHSSVCKVGQCLLAGQRLDIMAPVGDQQATLLGVGLRPGELSVNVATGSQVSMLRSSSEAGDYQLRPYFDGNFLHTITHIPAGRALNAWIQLLTELQRRAEQSVIDPWPLILSAVAAVPTSPITVDLALFDSAYGNMGEVRGVREDTLTVGHLFRAAFENMASNYEKSALRIAPRHDWECVVFSGGLAQKVAPLREAVLKRLGSMHRTAPQTEDALVGLLVLAVAAEHGLKVSEALRMVAEVNCETV